MYSSKERNCWRHTRVATILIGSLLSLHSSQAQQLLTLDSCRAMALRNNKQVSISKLKQDVAANTRRSARTKYLPRVSAIGTYQHTSDEISLLSDVQKGELGCMGTSIVGGLRQDLSAIATKLPLEQVTPMFSALGLSTDALTQIAGQSMGNMADRLNAVGEKIADAFTTDTRNLWVGSVMLTQPVFMGGSIIAMNRMADISEQMALNSTEARRQETIYSIDKAYWQVVSLHHKKVLAESYLELVSKLSGDVNKMIEEGVATRSDGLSVEVKVNEAEMTLTKVNDGLVLSRMLLCQLCGLPMNAEVTLADEKVEAIAAVELRPEADLNQAIENRPELKMLQNSIDLSRQATNVMRAGALPQVALMGGYTVSNPNVLNGFEKKFAGFWNVGLLVRVPIWNWGDVGYKVRAAKGSTSIASLELEEAREKIELQVNQAAFRVDEANKRLTMAETAVKRANENLRTADLGFREGVITPSTVMEAQTAWLQAKSQKIDAEIDVRLSHTDLLKSLGTLQ